MGKYLLLLLLTGPMVFAGPFRIGVKGGIPITSNFTTGQAPGVVFTADTDRWTVGPEVGIDLPLGFGLEFDALYRRLNYQSTQNVADIFVRSTTTANTWDIPVLLKFRFAPGPIKPYVSAGPTFRYLTNLDQIRNFFAPSGQTATQQTERPAELQNRFATGLTIAGGLQLGLPIIRVSPEIRYIRWGWQNFTSPSSVFHSNDNEVLFLVGITF